MEISHRDSRNHKIVILKGELDYFSSKEVREVLFKFIHEKTKSIILDLRDVPFIDSAGMGLLITVNKELNKIDGKIGLLSPSKDVLDLMILATLDKLIQIYDNEDDIK
ncbi:MAG: STAS domain-containing protein [Spirochaetes bacterium]|nr:STAS domain-containing protein [Spirochaetota bacterium]